MPNNSTLKMKMLALHGYSKQKILDCVSDQYYDISFSLDEIRPTYSFNETCQNTVPQAIVAFRESVGFEDAIKNAVSLGGDSDTLACITGAIAGAFYGVPKEIYQRAVERLDGRLRTILEAFEKQFGHFRA